VSSFFLNPEALNGTGALGRAPVPESNAVAAPRDRLKLLTAISVIIQRRLWEASGTRHRRQYKEVM